MIAIPLGAKRYDGGSGAAVFTGCIPLKPGQLVEAGAAGSRQLTVSLWAGATEIPSFATCLHPQHPDGSAKVLQISAPLDLPPDVERPLTLKLGTAPAVALPANAGPQRIDAAWMKNPLLLGCTDAWHLCASRVAPFPLVPLAHPNLTPQLRAFLSTEFDRDVVHFPSYGAIVKSLRTTGDNPPNYPWQNANYNALAPLYYRYLTTGELDKLRDAHLLQQSSGWSWGWKYPNPGGYISYGNGLVKYAADYQGIAAGTDFPVDEFGAPMNPNPVGGAEWQSGFHHDAYIGYCLSGWQQPLGAAVAFGLRALPGTAGGVHFGNPAAKLDASAYGVRLDWRTWRERDVFYAMLSLPMTLRQSLYMTTIAESPRTHRAKYQAYFRAKYYDKAEEYCRGFAPTGDRSSFLHGVWGFSPTYQPSPAYNNIPGTYPAFGAISFFNAIMLCFLNVVQDPRVIPELVKYAYLLLSNLRGPSPTSLGSEGSRELYRMPYMIGDAAYVDAMGQNHWGPPILLALWAWAYRATGDPKFLAVATACATHKANMYTATSGVGRAFKQIGEAYQMAFAAVAWLAGVPADGWDAPVTGPIPLPEPEPIPDPIPTPDPGGPPMANGSAVVSLTLPASVVAGRPFPATIRMKNTGTTAWAETPTTPHRLGAEEPMDNFHWGPHRTNLPAGVVVLPGEEVDFTGTFTAPLTLGTQPFTRRMVQEQVQWFGPVARAIVTVTAAVPAPPPPPVLTPEERLVALESKAAASLLVEKDLTTRIGTQEQTTGRLVTGLDGQVKLSEALHASDQALADLLGAQGSHLAALEGFHVQGEAVHAALTHAQGQLAARVDDLARAAETFQAEMGPVIGQLVNEGALTESRLAALEAARAAVKEAL